jgi:hypothetical protein
LRIEDFAKDVGRRAYNPGLSDPEVPFAMQCDFFFDLSQEKEKKATDLQLGTWSAVAFCGRRAPAEASMVPGGQPVFYS